MGIHDVDATLLIKRVAEELKKDASIKPPAWAPFVKTGVSRERPPVQDDWWFVRSAAVLRKLFLLGPVGTQKLRTIFGGRKNNGYAPDHYYPGSGSVLRKILQQLEKSGLAKQTAKGFHKGRVIGPRGQQLLENVSSVIMKEQGIVLPAKPKEELKIEAEVKEEKQKKPRAPRKPRAKKVKIEAPEVANVNPQTPG
ncbi:30S ribosomal protein S19e [uncultured archaeon]|nr:30S ribosomal protein S19e [uncultured archaeon]